MEVTLLIILGVTLIWREWLGRVERREWSIERQILCDRIQAPEKAVWRDFEPTKQHVTFDSDSEFWEAQREADAA